MLISLFIQPVWLVGTFSIGYIKYACYKRLMICIEKYIILYLGNDCEWGTRIITQCLNLDKLILEYSYVSD